jgi:hypothetical protein
MRCLIVLLLAMTLTLNAMAGEPTTDRELDTLIWWMTGSFSSEAQAQEDGDFLHIVLHMARIWADRSDGVWLYVEQAVASSTDKPYRQRVYRVRRVGEDLFASSVYTFEDPLERAGAWRTESPLAGLSPDDLKPRVDCTIYLKLRPGGAFEGSPLGRLCSSKLRGSTWASSEVVVRPAGLVSWDRGWNDAGSQVWGAEKAGYQFDRVAGAD